MRPPGVDVVVPCYNYGRYLGRCVGSVLAQQDVPVRVLIVDDASRDDSAQVARDLAKDPRVEVVVHPHNRGHVATFNEGLDWASADYTLLLSADDMVAPGALARAVALMEAHPSVAFVHGSIVRFHGEDELAAARAEERSAARPTILEGVAFIDDVCRRAINPVETASAVVRSSVQKRVGGYNPALPHTGDLEMWLRCAAQGDVGVIRAVQAFVHLHEANMRHGYLGESDLRQRHAAFRAFFEAHRGELAGGAALERIAARSLSAEAVTAAIRALDNGRAHAGLMRTARHVRPGAVWTLDYAKALAKTALRRPSLARPPASAAPADAREGRRETRPTLSLVVSTRDRGPFLAPFLASLSAIRTRQAWELVIVDNGSVDDTRAILAKFAASPPTRTLVVRETAPGLSHARNAGVRAASGAIVCFTDDDCYPKPDFIDAVAAVFEDADIGFMGGQILLHDPADDPVCITTRTSRVLFPPGAFITTGEIQGACMAFRREVFADVGLFDTAFGAGGPLKGAEDCEMIARACFAGWPGGFFTEPVIHHHHRRRGRGAERITWSYDYSRGAFFAKLLLRYPKQRRLIIRHWHWVTPIFWRPSQRAFTKFWRELQGACRYAVLHSRSAQERLS